MLPLFAQDALDAARAAFPNRPGLSRRLLAYVAGFVLAAELLILAPTVAAFRTQWLEQRVEAAQLASLALVAAPNAMVTDELSSELLANAEVHTVLLQRDGRRQLVLQSPAPVMATVVVDLRDHSMWRSMRDTVATLLAAPEQHMRVTATPRLGGGEAIVVVLAQDPLKRELSAYGVRVLRDSILISVAAGALIYLVLIRMFVGPMSRLATAMVRFRAAPEDAERVIRPSARDDEIGVAERELAALQQDVRQALRQQERLAALGAAVAKINHDLRNVLTSAQLISDRLAAHPDPRTRGQGERLVRAIGRGVRLAEDVLRYGRAEEPAPRPETVALQPLLEDAFQEAAAVIARTVEVEVSVEPGLHVHADPEHAHRMFANLMRNAVQAMGAMEDAALRLAITARRDADAAIIAITDTGPGIPPRITEHLFKPFMASTRKGGSGLGLAIARELAHANGGDVRLSATSDEGATFEVTLPVAAAVASS